MSIINKISFLLNHRDADKTDTEGIQNTLLLNYTLVILSILSITFSIIHFFFFERFFSYLLFSYFILFSGVIIFYKNSANYKVSSNIALVLIASLYIFIIYLGIGDNTGILWGLTFPIVVSIAFGFRKGNIISLLFLAVTLFIFFVPSDLWVEYSAILKIRYIAAYLGILFILQYYLRIQHQTNNDYEKKIIEIQRKIDEKDKLLSKLSYQIRTPLNNIAGITNLNHSVLDKNTIEEIEFSISNLITIVNSISNYSDKKALKIKGKRSLFNINSTIKKTTSLFQTGKYSDLKCSLKLSDTIIEDVYGDRLLFIQIVLSVIDFLYSNKNSGNLKIELISDEKEISGIIVVKIISYTNYDVLKQYAGIDSYVDIDSLENKDVFIIKDLTDSINGKFDISYTENVTSFIFNFNLSDKKNESFNKSKIFVNKSQNRNLKLEDAVILIVEDDVINSKIITLNLEKHVGEIILAENGKEALDKFGSTKIDLILMDIRMPLMDGYKTTQKIRKAETGIGNKIPIIAVTANASAETKKRCLEVGMNGYTTKPVNFKLLLKKMKELLS